MDRQYRVVSKESLDKYEDTGNDSVLVDVNPEDRGVEAVLLWEGGSLSLDHKDCIHYKQF